MHQPAEFLTKSKTPTNLPHSSTPSNLSRSGRGKCHLDPPTVPNPSTKNAFSHDPYAPILPSHPFDDTLPEKNKIPTSGNFLSSLPPSSYPVLPTFSRDFGPTGPPKESIWLRLPGPLLAARGWMGRPFRLRRPCPKSLLRNLLEECPRRLVFHDLWGHFRFLCPHIST